MTEHLNSIASTLIQSTGLLLPVAFLTFRFYTDYGDPNISERRLTKIGRQFGFMVLLLAITGAFATLGLLRTPMKDYLLFLAVVTLAIYFLIYARFIYSILPDRP